MAEAELSKEVLLVLSKAGFTFSTIPGKGGQAFDIVTRRDDMLLLIKLAPSKESIRPEGASEMKLLCNILKAAPLILLASRPRSGFQDGVMYIRQGIPLMTFNTFFDHLIENVPPMVYFSTGGHFVAIDGARLKQVRESRGISLGTVSEAAGVSRKAIQMYEEGMGVDIEVALKLEAFLNVPLILPLDPFKYDHRLQGIRDAMAGLDEVSKEVFAHLGSIGMEVIPTHRCPFDALAMGKGGVLITSVGRKPLEIREQASALSRISQVTDRESLMVVADPIKKRNIEGTPVLNVAEVKEAKDIDRLLQLLRERKR